jgi:hypothetical protein
MYLSSAILIHNRPKIHKDLRAESISNIIFLFIFRRCPCLDYSVGRDVVYELERVRKEVVMT